MPWGSRTPARRLKKQHRLQRSMVELSEGLKLTAKKEHVYVRAANELGAELIAACERCANRPQPLCRRCGEAPERHDGSVLRAVRGGCAYEAEDRRPPCACDACQRAQLCLTINRKAIEEVLVEELDMVKAQGLEKPDAMDASAVEPVAGGPDGKTDEVRAAAPPGDSGGSDRAAR